MRTRWVEWTARLLAIASSSACSVSGSPFPPDGVGGAGSGGSGDVTGGFVAGGSGGVAFGGSTGTGGGLGGSDANLGGQCFAGQGSGAMVPVFDGTNRFPCRNPTPIGGPDSGLVHCENGLVHRARAGTCAQAAGDFGCTADEECGPDSLCSCDALGTGQCMLASCRSDAECAPGFLCASTFACAGVPASFACQTAEDRCAVNADCPSPSLVCQANGCGSARACMFMKCAAGRPFVVEGAARTSQSQPGAAWLDATVTPALDGMKPEFLAHLAANWLQSAELEHASVASFARFTLELLALSAPAPLVEASAAAMADEVAHARLCYALASAYAGAAHGPGPLNVRGALDGCELGSVFERAFLEGCVGETLAALEAREAAAHAEDPVVRDALERIGADEARHAELAWRFLAWAVPLDRGRLAPRLRLALRKLIATEPDRAQDEHPAQQLLGAGILPGALRAELRSRVLAEVIRPCVDALLEPAAPAQSELRA